MSRTRLEPSSSQRIFRSRSRGKHHNPEHLSSKDNSSQAARQEHLNAEILRIRAQQQLQHLSKIWDMEDEELLALFKEYQTIFQVVNCSQLLEMSHSKMVRGDEKIFLGQIYHKQKHGQGITIYRDGRVYEGQYHRNQKEGRGCEIYSNGNMYLGQYHQNKKHGKGTFFWFSLTDSTPSKTEQPKVQQYEGTWWGGLPDGQGQHQKSNGDFYLGSFKNGLKHGQGVQYYSNGDKYQGHFINGLPQGFGEYIWRDKSSYRGDFKQGYRNGYGVWHCGGQHYKGHYMLDRKHGYGIYQWGNGYVYKGNFVQDMRNGEGGLYYYQQVVHNGFWLNGEKCQEEEYRGFLDSGKTVSNTAASRHSRNCKSKKKSKNKDKNGSFMINFRQTQLIGHAHCPACSLKKNKSKKLPRLSAQKSHSCDRPRNSYSRGRP